MHFVRAIIRKTFRSCSMPAQHADPNNRLRHLRSDAFRLFRTYTAGLGLIFMQIIPTGRFGAVVARL